MRRHIPHFRATLIIAATLTLVVAASAQRSEPNSPPQARWKKRTDAVIADMTSAERQRSFAFQSFRTSTKLLDTQRSVAKLDFIIQPPPAPADQVFRNLACATAATFVGTVTAKASHPIADGTFLFTDYAVDLDEPIRMPQGGATFRRGDSITLSRPGGALIVDGVYVEATTNTFKPLVEGVTYLFFASYLATQGAFVSTDDWGTFSLVGDHVIAHRPLPVNDLDFSFPKTNRGAFLRSIHSGRGYCR